MPGWRCRRRRVYLICYERNVVYKVLLYICTSYALYTTLHPNIHTQLLFIIICTMYRFITPQTHYYYIGICVPVGFILAQSIYYFANSRFVYQARIAMPSDSDYVYCLMNGNKGITKVGTQHTLHSAYQRKQIPLPPVYKIIKLRLCAQHAQRKG